MISKKTITKVLSLFIITACVGTVSTPAFASTISSKVTNNSSKANVQAFANSSSVPQINKSKVEVTLKEYVKSGAITQDYANKIDEVLDKYSSEESDKGIHLDSFNYYNKKTGARIVCIESSNLMTFSFNKAGWNIIKEVINIGGGSTTIGFGVAALCGMSVSGPVAGIIGGAIVVANGAVNLQFALGNTYAVLPIPY